MPLTANQQAILDSIHKRGLVAPSDPIKDICVRGAAKFDAHPLLCFNTFTAPEDKSTPTEVERHEKEGILAIATESYTNHLKSASGKGAIQEVKEAIQHCIFNCAVFIFDPSSIETDKKFQRKYERYFLVSSNTKKQRTGRNTDTCSFKEVRHSDPEANVPSASIIAILVPLHLYQAVLQHPISEGKQVIPVVAKDGYIVGTPLEHWETKGEHAKVDFETHPSPFTFPNFRAAIMQAIHTLNLVGKKIAVHTTRLSNIAAARDLFTAAEYNSPFCFGKHPAPFSPELSESFREKGWVMTKNPQGEGSCCYAPSHEKAELLKVLQGI